MSVVADDLQNLIDAEMEEVLREEDDDGLNYRDPSKSYYDPANYNRLRQIITHLDELQTQFGGSMSVSSIGSTAEGRQIKMATLRSGYGGSKPAVWLDCGIHAREWVSPAFCMHSIKQMLEEGENGNFFYL